MKVSNVASIGNRGETARAGVRVNSRVPVAVEWTEDGQAMRAEGHTVDTSTKGCLALMPQGPAVGEKAKLVNLISQQACEAVVAWRGHQGRGGWELGLQLFEAPLDFWGVDLY